MKIDLQDDCDFHNIDFHIGNAWRRKFSVDLYRSFWCVKVTHISRTFLATNSYVKCSSKQEATLLALECSLSE